MLIGCFFWAAIFGAHVIFGAIPTTALPYCLIHREGEYPTLYYPVKRHCIISYTISSIRLCHYKGLFIGVEWC